MGTITKTTNGHTFEIDGDIEPGKTVTVTIIPKSGYRFVKWNGNQDNIEEIGPDAEGHKRFNITIEECGITFSAVFINGGFTKEEYYLEILDLLNDNDPDDLPYDDTESIGEAEIQSLVNAILGIPDNTDESEPGEDSDDTDESEPGEDSDDTDESEPGEDSGKTIETKLGKVSDIKDAIKVAVNDKKDYLIVDATRFDEYAGIIDDNLASKTEYNEYDLTFDANGGTVVGDMHFTSLTDGSEIRIPSFNGTKQGYTYMNGWSDTQDGQTVKYREGDNYVVEGPKTFYAVWYFNGAEVSWDLDYKTIPITFYINDEEQDESGEKLIGVGTSTTLSIMRNDDDDSGWDQHKTIYSFGGWTGKNIPSDDTTESEIAFDMPMTRIQVATPIIKLNVIVFNGMFSEYNTFLNHIKEGKLVPSFISQNKYESTEIDMRRDIGEKMDGSDYGCIILVPNDDNNGIAYELDKVYDNTGGREKDIPIDKTKQGPMDDKMAIGLKYNDKVKETIISDDEWPDVPSSVEYTIYVYKKTGRIVENISYLIRQTKQNQNE